MKKILVIDDDLFVVNTCYNQLMAEGYFVKSAQDGKSGLETMREFKPDVILLDLMLPKVPGLEVIKQVRSEEEFYKTPIIVFTNAFETSMVQDAWKAGATKCISKADCTPKELLAVMQRTIEDSIRDRNISAPFGQPPVPPVAAAPETPAAVDTPADLSFQAGLRKTCFDSQPVALGALRAALQMVTKAENEQTRLKQLYELHRRVHTLAGNAGLAGMIRVSHLASALEALLKELHDKPKNINTSTLRTIATGVDLLGLLFQHDDGKEELPAANILVVDDEEISRRAIVYSLEKAQLQSVTADSGEAAYQLLLEKQFDLIFLDVHMPGMSGIDLCAQLRTHSSYKKTPVVFVTALSDFYHRSGSIISGGNDFIAKPFLFIELTVKALVYVLRGKLTPMK